MKIPTDKDESLIPPGSCCYHFIVTDENERHLRHPTLVCPYWDSDRSKGEQSFGYCHYLKCGDWEENGTLLLWDMCKECGINHDDSMDIDPDYDPTPIIEWVERVMKFYEDDDEYRDYRPMIQNWVDRMRREAEKIQEKRNGSLQPTIIGDE